MKLLDPITSIIPSTQAYIEHLGKLHDYNRSMIHAPFTFERQTIIVRTRPEARSSTECFVIVTSADHKHGDHCDVDTWGTQKVYTASLDNFADCVRSLVRACKKCNIRCPCGLEYYRMKWTAALHEKWRSFEIAHGVPGPLRNMCQ